MKTSEVLGGKYKLKGNKSPTPVQVYTEAVMQWREENEVSGSMFSLPQADKGILNKCAKKLDSEGYEWEPIFKNVIEHWNDFVQYVGMMQGGLSAYPAHPVVKFIYKYIQLAAQFKVEADDQSAPKFKKGKLKITKKTLDTSKVKDKKTKAMLEAAGYGKDGTED